MVESDFPIFAYVESRALLEHASQMAESAGVDRGSWLRLAVSLHASDCIDCPDRAVEDFQGSITNVFEAAETDEGEYVRVPMRSQVERDDIHQIVASRDEDLNDFIIRALALRVDEWLEGGWDKALTGNPDDIPTIRQVCDLWTQIYIFYKSSVLRNLFLKKPLDSSVFAGKI